MTLLCRRLAVTGWLSLVLFALAMALGINVWSFFSGSSDKAVPLLSSTRGQKATVVQKTLEKTAEQSSLPGPPPPAKPRPQPERDPTAPRIKIAPPQFNKPPPRPKKVPARPLAVSPGCERAVDALEQYERWRYDALAFIDSSETKSADEPFPSRLPDGSSLSVAAFSRLGGAGWGDRIPALISLLAFSLRYRRVFVADYPAISPWIESPLLELDVDPASSHPYLAWAVKHTRPSMLYSCGEDCLWVLEKPGDSYPASIPIHHIAANRGLWATTSRGDHILWAKDSGLFPQCLHQLLLRPTAALLAAAEPYLKPMQELRQKGRTSTRIIGFHYRVGGEKSVHSQEQETLQAQPLTYHDLDPSFKGILTACLSLEDTSIYFFSDSQSLKEDLQQRFGDRILLAKHDAKSAGVIVSADEEVKSAKLDDTEALKEVLIDWWTLAQTDFIVLASSSGFARSAVAASSHGSFTIAGTSFAPAANCLQPQYRNHDSKGLEELMTGGGSGF